jgi:ubiquinone/menaquinone biosynthesis C-methylase UbiE
MKTIDQKKSEAFQGQMIGILNGGALSVMISIGHRTGLFDAMETSGSGSSTALASAANLDERYVREWLGSMVTGGIVEYDEMLDTYELPPEHACVLTRSAGLNMSVFAEFIPLLGGVEDGIVECFEKGGGLGYEAFPRFQEVMAELSAQTVVAALEGSILPLVGGLKDDLERGIDVLDIGCGSGHALLALAERFPKSRFRGVDLSTEATTKAKLSAADKQLTNVSFEAADLMSVDFDQDFELVTAFDVIHDQADPAGVLDKVHRALRPGGSFLMQDIHASSHVHENLDHPIAPMLYMISTNHCMTVSLATGGAGLGTCWGQEMALEMLERAGFRDAVVTQLPHDPLNSYYVSRKARASK